MTRKQIKKTAETIYGLQKLHSDPETSPKRKQEIENMIFKITAEIMREPNFEDILGEIDNYGLEHF